MGATNSIIHYYDSLDDKSPLKGREGQLRAALEAELADNALKPQEMEPAVRGGLLLPLLLLAAALLFSALSLWTSLRTYSVQMEALFFRPNNLFTTEALLIEALRKRTDMEISKRDMMIEEFRRRATLRENILNAGVAGALPEGAVREASPAAEAAEVSAAELEDLRRAASMEALYARRLEQALAASARHLSSGDLQGAEAPLAELRRSIGPRDGTNSPLAASALGIAAALSSGIAGLNIDQVRQENDALLGRIAELEARAVSPALPAAAPVPETPLPPRVEAPAPQAAETRPLQAPATAATAAPAAVPAPAPAPATETVPAPVEEPLPSLAAAHAAEVEALPRLPSPQAAAAAEPTPPSVEISEGEAARPAPRTAPSGAFLGTVAVAAEHTLLVDLAQGARPQVGERVEVFGFDLEGRPFLRAEGRIRTVRAGTAELDVSPLAPSADEGAPNLSLPKVRDTVYTLRLR